MNICFPQNYVTKVEDVYEEIFLIFTEKANSVSSHSLSHVYHDNLGGFNRKQSNISIDIVWSSLQALGWYESSKIKISDKEHSMIVNLRQDLHRLHSTRGDTGSVVWRSSILFTQMVLSQTLLPTHLQLFPNLKDATVLELGAGTGFLASAIADQTKRWIATDLFDAIKLIETNVSQNKKSSFIDVYDVDWLDAKQSPFLAHGSQPHADLILAIDCIYNPHLSKPLANTMDRLAIPGTKALVFSELRDEDPLMEFLEHWIDLGWSISRICLPFSLFDESTLITAHPSQFVLWLGEKEK